MDRLESLSNTISQITLYDIKAAYNQAKNVVLNISEMEAKVREATNEDPWGASSTLMQEIAQGTFTFQHFNEIMPCIYSRFMEKEARQWRQIYKALQLLEYLIKHGSERVVDDARSHVSTIKMLRNFHYIDEKGKDEGINVRNRAREIVELLSDVEKIRAERRKAKANKHKYTGTGNDGFGGGIGSRYGGFGNDGFSGGGGSYGNDWYGAGGSGGQSSFRDDSRRAQFEEYNAGDDEDVPPRSPGSRSQASGRASTTTTRKASAPAPTPAPAPVEDLLGGFGDDDALGSQGTNKALPAVAAPAVSLDDDDFADFQAAPVQPTTTGTAVPAPAPAPVAAAKPNLMDLLNSAPARPAASPAVFGQVQQPPAYGGANMGIIGTGGSTMHRSTPSMSSQFSSPLQAQPLQAQAMFGGSTRPAAPAAAPALAPAAQSKSTGGGAFDDLWSMSLGGSAAKPAAASGASKSIKDLEREKAMAGLWGGGQKPAPGAGAAAGANAFGSFGTSAPASGGGDDLLL
ncbi:putative epsin N-terminal homology (ENTH) domain containing protein [Lyophyllum shimeji]|uniref:Epsin N-terminal homology (ENTH) domain containing protein n=1 Tax=Lyophyllum shimeji TaxID=47721 RepID=A0A9P3PNL9_LYOSH|nr:putative epsin N-terminal homology (ENTH) domain containing protein [Lyophyllum shimeji]